MDALTLLTTRRSVRELTAPAPDAQQLETMFQAATQVPDHGHLTPWHYVVIEGGAAKDRLRKALDETVAVMGYDEAVAKKAEKIAAFAPLTIIVIAKPKSEGPKPKPVCEQHMSAAASAYALQLAAAAQGYGSVWLTGVWCDSPVLRRETGASGDDKIIGLLMVGTAAGDPKQGAKNTDTAQFVSRW